MEQALWFFISLPAKAVLPLDKRESYFVLFLKFLLLGKRRGTARGGGVFSLHVLVFFVYSSPLRGAPLSMRSTLGTAQLQICAKVRTRFLIAIDSIFSLSQVKLCDLPV